MKKIKNIKAFDFEAVKAETKRSFALKSKRAKKAFLKLNKIEVKDAFVALFGIIKFQIKIRPRMRLFSKFILILTLLFLVSSQMAEFVEEKEDEIEINGRKILVAQDKEAKKNLEVELSQEVHIKLSPFQFEKPVDGYVSQGYRAYHRANDIAAPFGSPIHSVGAGVVEFAGRVNDGRGNMVIIDHGDGLKTAYAHMGKIAVGTGNQVEAKTYLGTVGMTGRTTGPHLHLEVFDRDVAVDPLSVLPR